MDTEEIFDNLTNTLGFFAKEATGRNVVLGMEGAWNKPSGEFILVDLQAAEPVRWGDEIGYNEEGRTSVTHNFTVTYLLTAFRGKTHTALSKLVQGFQLPYLYYKHFPAGSFFSFSTSSSVSRTRVPLEEQVFENQSSVILTFNVRFMETDVNEFETVETINITEVVDPLSGEKVTVDVPVHNPE